MDEATRTFGNFTFIGACGHVIRVENGRQLPHEHERPTITLSPR